MKTTALRAVLQKCPWAQTIIQQFNGEKFNVAEMPCSVALGRNFTHPVTACERHIDSLQLMKVAAINCHRRLCQDHTPSRLKSVDKTENTTGLTYFSMFSSSKFCAIMAGYRSPEDWFVYDTSSDDTMAIHSTGDRFDQRAQRLMTISIHWTSGTNRLFHPKSTLFLLEEMKCNLLKNERITQFLMGEWPKMRNGM